MAQQRESSAGGASPERVGRALRRFLDLTLRHRRGALGLGPGLDEASEALLAEVVSLLESGQELGSAEAPLQRELDQALVGTPLAPPALEGEHIRFGGQTFAVLSYPDPGSPEGIYPALRELTTAERSVALLLVGGRTNAEIAAARSTTPRTVAKQVDAIYKKLDVHSRRELARRLTEE